jgi:hypothetical protein
MEGNAGASGDIVHGNGFVSLVSTMPRASIGMARSSVVRLYISYQIHPESWKPSRLAIKTTLTLSRYFCTTLDTGRAFGSVGTSVDDRITGEALMLSAQPQWHFRCLMWPIVARRSS